MGLSRQAHTHSKRTVRVLPQQRLLRQPHNLPAQLSSFIGRERELADLRPLLAHTRLLTLAGPG
jgi:hypothetical protein